MRATAELAREGLVLGPDGHHAHDVAVLLAKQRDGAGGLRLVDAHDAGDDGLRREDLGVDLALDSGELVGRHGLEVREVEAQPVGSNKGARLVHVLAQDLLQRGVQEVRRGVVAADELTAAVVDGGAHRGTHADLALNDLALVGGEAALAVQRVLDPQLEAVREDPAGVTDLAAHLAVERGAVEHDLDLLALLGRGDLLAVPHEGDDGAAVQVVVVVAVEDGLVEPVGERGPHVVGLAPRVAVRRGARTLLLGVHRAVERVHVNLVTGALGDLAREVDGESVGVVQLERDLAGQDVALAQLVELRLEHGLAGVQRGAEALLLRGDDAVHEGLVLHELVVVLAHDALDLVGVLGQERALDAEQASVVDGAAEQAAQHVAAALVRGQDAVRDHERHGAGVVREDAEALVAGVRGACAVLLAREPLAELDEGAHDVALVVGALVLHDGGHALQAHAGVDVAVREVRHGAVLLAVVLREDEVPELEVAVAVVTGLLALELRTLVEVDLGAGAARAGGSGRPEVVLLAQARDVVVLDALGVPELDGLVVVLEDRHVQAVLRKAQVLGTRDELPCPRDRVCLRVAAEAEVAEHLEEREVARVADVVDVVGAQALLAGGRADLLHGLRALVVLLELVHAGVRKEERRVLGDEGGGRVELAALVLEELEEVLADFRGSHVLVVSSAHGSPC